MKNIKVCPSCKEQFGSNDSRKKYCSPECYYKMSYTFQEKDTIGHLILQSKKVEVTNRGRRTKERLIELCGLIFKNSL